MATRKFLTYIKTDREIVDALAKIAGDVGTDQTKISLQLTAKQAVNASANAISENQQLQDVLNVGRSLAESYSLSQLIGQASLTLRRDGATLDGGLSLVDQMDFSMSNQVVVAVDKYLPICNELQDIEEILGPELANHYARREEGLARLEEISQRQIEKNEEYRRNLDQKKSDFETKLRSEYAEQEKTLTEQIAERQEKLAEREKEIDDRANVHVRRELRQDLKKALKERSTKFELTKGTGRKRWPIHALFVVLLIVTALFFGYSISKFSQLPSDWDARHWLYVIRSIFGGLAFIGLAVAYIQWMDRWFRQHADEEFRLRQLDLDIDRASWVAEMTMEWRDTKEVELPDFLLQQLTNRLFETDSKAGRKRDKDEAAALLSAAKKLTLHTEWGDVVLDRSALKRFTSQTEND